MSEKMFPKILKYLIIEISDVTEDFCKRKSKNCPILDFKIEKHVKIPS